MLYTCYIIRICIRVTYIRVIYYIIHAIYVLYMCVDYMLYLIGQNLVGEKYGRTKYGRTKIWTDKNMDGQKGGHICHFCPHFVRPNLGR